MTMPTLFDILNIYFLLATKPWFYPFFQMHYLQCLKQSRMEKPHLKKGAFPYHLFHKPLITMSTGWPCAEHSFTILRPTLGSSIFMTIVLIHFLSGFSTGGHGSDAVRQFFLIKQKKDGGSWKRTPHPLNHIPEKYSSFGF